MIWVRPLVVTTIAVACASAFSSHASTAQSAGVYTQAQAAQGAQLYAGQCASCHGVKLEGGTGPQLAGSDFIGKWSGQTAGDVHDIISTQMPQTAPGSLKPAESLALIAYILQQNKYAAGASPLDVAKLNTIKIVKQ